MDFQLNYGKGKAQFSLPEARLAGIVSPNPVPTELLNEAEVLRSLEKPIGSLPLDRIVEEGEKVVVVTSDITRPVPSYRILPILMDELLSSGTKVEDITIVLALGSHRKHTEEEKRALVGEDVFQLGVGIIDSDMDDCVRLGFCQNGTPVDVFRPVAEADRIICVGNIEFHYFAGYSGGAKAIMPGTSSHDAIQANHSNMVKEGACAGNLDTNPVRQDIDQILEFITIDFIVNVVLDEKKNIVKSFAGDPILAHREGCRFLDGMYKIPIERKADVVILSPGGFPKDINIYQSQKGLDNAGHAVRDGGIVIWSASAAEGFGEKTFEEWMRTKTPDEMIEEIRTNFKLGGHKAAAIAMLLKKAKIYLVSDLQEDLVRSIHFVPYGNIQEALDDALLELGREAKVLVMPQAGSTLPYVR
jgi:nickel-dependent lactate racemase